jgi:peptidyl-prolyl cis-trans isomerase B (cyclophilin B)
VRTKSLTTKTQRAPGKRSALICDARHGVSTGSGSDRVSGDNKIELASSLTRSLPLPVLTSSLKLGHYPGKGSELLCVLCVFVVCFFAASSAFAQNPPPSIEALKKANPRPAETKPPAEPFAGASVEKMRGQCVTLDTENGAIVIEMLPASAPETVRSFLNLSASGALDTTIFSRVVKGFVIQGGNLSTSEKWGPELAERMSRRLPDEPSDLKHVRGIVSMARPEEPNSATTHFFILVDASPHLDGTFTAFGRVLKGLEVADAINRAPTDGEQPVVPVRIKHATVAACQK